MFWLNNIKGKFWICTIWSQKFRVRNIYRCALYTGVYGTFINVCSWLIYCEYLFLQRPAIQVFLMDGTFRTLNLLSGADTTVQQLHSQMMKASTHLYKYIYTGNRVIYVAQSTDLKLFRHCTLFGSGGDFVKSIYSRSGDFEAQLIRAQPGSN